MEETERETLRARMKGILDDYQLSRQAAADMLNVSIETLHAWLKPQSSQGRKFSPPPLMAIELLEYKVGAAGKPARKKGAK